MSCSDKILSWGHLGLQGALLGQFLDDEIKLSSIIVEVKEPENQVNQGILERGLLFEKRFGKEGQTSPIIR